MPEAGAAQEQDLVFNQQGKFQYTVQLLGVALPINGWTARMEISSVRGEPTVEYASYTTSNYLSIVPSSGQILIDIPHSVTDTYTWDRAVYDLKGIDATGQEFRVLQGKIRLSKKVK